MTAPAAEPSVARLDERRVVSPTAFQWSDAGNAERFVAEHGEDVRYCHPWSRWLLWDGVRWRTDETGAVVKRAKATVRAMLREAVDADDKSYRSFALSCERDARIRGMLTLAQSERPVLPADLDASPWLLNVANGTVDLQTGELLPHRREDMLTNLAPVTFDADAKAPTWDTFLERVLPDTEVRALLQRFLGYCLTGLTVERLLAIFWGPGANGKSTLIETLRALLGDYGQQAPAETFLERRDGIPNDVARLRGARLVAATELAEGRRLNEALVKRMTGGDTLVARFMRGEWFEFEMNAKVILATNHKPEIRGTDQAIWDRIRLFPFIVTIPTEERDHELAGKLRAEFSGILNWAVTGCLSWQRDGLGDAAAVTAATADYRADSDLLGDFLTDRCVVAPNARAKAGDLYAAYSAWLAENHESAVPQRRFGMRLRERGFTDSRTGSARWWDGVGLLADSALFDSPGDET